MIEEHAVVVSLENELAVLEVVRKTPCSLCGQTKGCGISIWGRIFGHKRSLFKAQNSVQAKVGDIVVVGIDDSAVLRSAMMLYGLPLMGLFIGAFVAQCFSNPEHADLNTFLGAVGGLGAMLIWLKGHFTGAGVSQRYQPVILRAQSNVIIQTKCQRG